MQPIIFSFTRHLIVNSALFLLYCWVELFLEKKTKVCK